MGTVPFYYLHIASSLLSLIYAAHAAVRFRGTHDRLNLTLAFGFALAGLISTISVFEFYARLVPGDGQSPVPLFWMVGRTLLALVILAALVVERRVPHSRDPGGEAAIAFGVVCAMAYLDRRDLFRHADRAGHLQHGLAGPAVGAAAGGAVPGRGHWLRAAAERGIVGV